MGESDPQEEAVPRRFSRGEFFHRGLLVAGAGVLGSNTRAWAQLADTARSSDFVPAIVIGSGFGGVVAALRLGEAGIDTVVLERGRRWPIRSDGNTFATFEHPDGRAYWLRDHTAEGLLGFPQLEQRIDRYVGVLEVVEANGINIGAGAGVGGGSLVFNAIIVSPRRELFTRVFPRQVDFDEMQDVYYPRVQRIIGSAPMPDDILATEYYRSSRVSLEQARAAGFPTRPVELAIDWDIVRDEMAGRRIPSAIAGQVFYGLNSGAKRSLDRSYLALAEATGHVELLPQHTAVAIERGRGDRYVVTVLRLRDDGSPDGPPRQLLCRHLFLAAGSLGTTSLLVRAKARSALALNEHIGQHWAANGDIPVVRGLLPFTNSGTGGPAGHFILEDLENPIAPTSLVELVLPPPIRDALTALGAPQSFANYASLGIPPAIGYFSYDAATDAVALNWPGSDPRVARFLAAAQRTLAVLDERTGAATLAFIPNLSAHPLGGAVLGKACNFAGQVKEQPSLYVVDGSLIEGSSGLANPSFTIGALAERCMDRILPRLHDSGSS
jgi:cholesterol oxidase